MSKLFGTDFDAKARPSHHWKFGKECGLQLDCLSSLVRPVAAATCRIEIQGINSIGNEWGLGLAMRMQTYGEAPFGVGDDGEPCFSHCGNWVSTHSRQALEIVLNCFDLTVDKLLEKYGEPSQGEKYRLDLCEIVQGFEKNAEVA